MCLDKRLLDKRKRQAVKSCKMNDVIEHIAPDRYKDTKASEANSLKAGVTFSSVIL